jgi:mannan endo-1,4-beta-mannosidase
LRIAPPPKGTTAWNRAAPLGLLLLCALVVWAQAQQGSAPLLGRRAGFVGRSGTHFVLDGRPFDVAGVNNHYLPWGSDKEVIQVLDDAIAMHANVVRTFIGPVIGSPDGAIPTIWSWKSAADSSNLGVRGTYMVYWDPARPGMAVNDGANGLQRLDALIAEAGRRHLKLIVAFLDFWAYTGGAQQMSAWYGSRDKYTFFAADPRTRTNYKQLVRHILTRINSITAQGYKDDPTIFAWELMNEPDIRPQSLLRDWISEMSAFVKSIDPNHMLGTGHANVINRLWDLSIPEVDFGTWHGYPAYYHLSPDQFDALIRDFCTIGRNYDKPVLLEEFGMARSDSRQLASYRRWLDTIRQNPDCAGWLVWRLVSLQDQGRYPQDEYDQFDIHNDGSLVWDALKQAAINLQGRR